MKLFIIVLVKILLIAAAVYYLSDPASSNMIHRAQTICLQTDTTRRLCAACFRRDNQLPPNKGYQVISQGGFTPSSVLKIEYPEWNISCNDFLQFIEFQKDSLSGLEFNLETIASIQQIVDEIKGDLVFTKTPLSQAQYTIEPWYQQFVVYKWQDLQMTETTATSVDPEYYQVINSYLLYAFNFVLLIVLVAWLADNSFITDLSTPIKISLSVVVVCTELALLGLKSEIFHHIARIFILNLGLFKLKVHNFTVIGFILLGLVLTYFPVTLLIYIGIIPIMLTYYGRGQSQTRYAKLYLVIFYSLLLLNYSYWYQYVIYLNDIPSVVIEFLILTFIPTGLFLLPNQKEFQAYRPTDPEIRSISLSGYDEEEDMQG